MSKKTELVRNTLVLGLGNVSSKFIVFFLLPIYTHFLDPSQFGIVDLAITYVALLAPLMAIQLDRGAFRYLIDARGDLVSSAKIVSNTLRIVTVSLAVSVAVLFAVGHFADIPYLMLISGVVVATLFTNLFMQFARGLGKSVIYAISSVVLALSTIGLVSWLVIFAEQGASGVFTALMAANIITAVYLFVALRLSRYISFRNSDRKLQLDLLKFSLPLVPSAISWWAIQAADRTIISAVMGVASTGIYAAASRYALILNAFNTIFDLSWSESASIHINSKDRDKFFSDVYNTSFRLFATLGLLLIAVTPFVFSFIVGPEFQAAQTLVPIIVTGAFLQSIVSQYSVVYIAKKITREVLITSISAAAISLVLNVTLIRWIGLYAAPVSMVVAFAVIGVWRHFDIKKYVKVTFTRGLFAKLALLYAIIIGLYYIGHLYSDLLNLAIAIASFVIMSREPALAMVRKIAAKFRSA